MDQPHNNRMQSDQNTRSAFILAADARRHVNKVPMDIIQKLVDLHIH